MTTLVFLVLSIPAGLLRAWVITKIWVWFVLDLFPSAPHLGVIDAWGLTYLVTLLIHIPVQDPDEHPAPGFVQNVLLSLIGLGCGWVLVQFR